MDKERSAYQRLILGSLAFVLSIGAVFSLALGYEDIAILNSLLVFASYYLTTKVR